MESFSHPHSSVHLEGDGELSVEGDLTIHGVSRKVHFVVEGPTRLPRIPGATLGDRDLCSYKDQS